MIELAEATWLARRQAHRARVNKWTDGVLGRRAVGRAQPVDDFLFAYYSQSPAKLSRWHPGVGTLLLGKTASEYLQYRHYHQVRGGVCVDTDSLRSRTRAAQWILRLLKATQARKAQLGCFGMHEWAMVYRTGGSERQHPQQPLRLSEDAIARVVERQPLQCTHFDAFRFFSVAARPLNRTQLQRAHQADLEQPGCLHANMDLYKWSYKLSPLTSSDLVADCFQLARNVREVDMRASPYDLAALGYSPIAVETSAGREEYIHEQRNFTERGKVLRERLIDAVATIVQTISTDDECGTSSLREVEDSHR